MYIVQRYPDRTQIGVRKANLIKALNKYAKGQTSGDEAFNDTQSPYYQALLDPGSNNMLY